MSEPKNEKPFLNTQSTTEERLRSEGGINIVTKCHMCNQEHMVRVPLGAYTKWQRGELLHFAWPESTNEQREMLISGIDPVCWNKLIGPMDED